MCAEQEAETLVVGLPLNMNGSDGPAAERVEVCVEKLRGEDRRAHRACGTSVCSTKTAEAALIEADTRRGRRKNLVDKIAAQVLLQHYIDAHHAGRGGTVRRGISEVPGTPVQDVGRLRRDRLRRVGRCSPDATTVQGELERVIGEVTGETVRVHCSGRTDTGVHAREQVTHFDLCRTRGVRGAWPSA